MEDLCDEPYAHPQTAFETFQISAQENNNIITVLGFDFNLNVIEPGTGPIVNIVLHLKLSLIHTRSSESLNLFLLN